MGMILPDRSVIDRLKRAERDFATVLCDGLGDEWIIIPRLDVANPKRPYEVDMLLIHPDRGLLAIEVKGGAVRIENGDWQHPDSLTKKWKSYDVPPPRQSQDAAYELRNVLRESIPGLGGLHVAHAVALTDVRDLHGQLPIGTTPERVFLAPSLDTIERLVLSCLASFDHAHAFASDKLEMIVRTVAPNVEFTWDPGARARYSRDSLNRISTEHVRAMGSLDRNHRVLVTGSAGSGKTRLAFLWARRAIAADNRTLVICYNDPLAAFITAALPDHDLLTVGSFLRVARGLPGVPELPEPQDYSAKDRYWNRELIDHLLAHVDARHALFDTVIIDERQDFSPEWVTIVERLVKDDGRILCVADPGQDIYGRGFEMPADGWTLGHLSMNCRNTRAIARFLRRFGGGSPSAASPEGEPVLHHPATTQEELIAGVAAMIDRELARGIDAKNIAILTHSAADRDLFRERQFRDFTFGAWGNLSPTSIACETIKRAKGIECDAVIVASSTGTMPTNELYVAASRARNSLSFVAPPAMASLLFD